MVELIIIIFLINCFIFTGIIFDENSVIQPVYLCNKQNSEENSDEGDFEKIKSSTGNVENTMDANILDDLFGDLSEIAEFGKFGKN